MKKSGVLQKRSKSWRRGGLILIGLLTIGMTLSGCGGTSHSTSGASMDVATSNSAKGSVAPSVSSGKEVASDTAQSSNTASVSDEKDSVAFDQSTSSSSIMDETDYNRKIIYTAHITMQVKNYDDVQTKIRDLTQLSGGYILSFTDNQVQNETGGTFVLRIPSDGFNSFLKKLDQMTDFPVNKSIQGQDVSQQFVDLQAQLKAKETELDRLLNFMKQASTAKDLVVFSNQVSSVEQQVEQLKGKIRYLNEHVAFSTINIRLYQKGDGVVIKDPINHGPVMHRAYHAMTSSTAFLYRMFTGLFVVLAGALPVLIFLGIFAIIFGAVYVKFKKRAALRQPQYKNEKLESNTEQAENEPNNL